HSGRSGWTWYTGSAGWMYRLMVESLLGITKKINTLELNPCIPANWNSFVVHYRFRDTLYHITIKQNSEIKEARLRIDGQENDGIIIPLVDDRTEHEVELSLPLKIVQEKIAVGNTNVVN
ncbi:MAG: glycosyltransferase, partial [Chitinophagaceae bacterium]|nr:glycosyltransferase [Chitinophagaceae bacterium]